MKKGGQKGEGKRGDAVAHWPAANYAPFGRHHHKCVPCKRPNVEGMRKSHIEIEGEIWGREG